MIIDAHQHFWKLSRGDYGWLKPELETLYQDFLPSDLEPIMAECGVNLTIAVQAAPTVAETEYLLSLAQANDFIAGVVGWVDFESPDAVAEIERLATDPGFIGVRPMVQNIPNFDWLAQPSHEAIFQALSDRHLVFDALVRPQHLPALRHVVESHPDLAIVIDHGAKPPLRSGVPQEWFSEMEALSKFLNVSCKLSGLITEASADWKPEDLDPVISHLFSTFGPQKLIWGSDWPVIKLAGSYQRWFDVVKNVLSTYPDTDQAAVLGGNAARVYLTR